MAAASKFFKTQLCKAKVMVPVILQLEDFDLKLTKEALSHVVDFIYRGEDTQSGVMFLSNLSMIS